MAKKHDPAPSRNVDHRHHCHSCLPNSAPVHGLGPASSREGGVPICSARLHLLVKKVQAGVVQGSFPSTKFLKKSLTTAQVPKAGSTTWVYNMLVLAGSPLVNTSSKPLAHQASQTAEELPPDRGEGKVDQDHVDQLDRNLSTDDLLHEELRRYYPVPKNLEEVEKQALTFHVVSNMVFDLCISQVDFGTQNYFSAR